MIGPMIAPAPGINSRQVRASMQSAAVACERQIIYNIGCTVLLAMTCST